MVFSDQNQNGSEQQATETEATQTNDSYVQKLVEAKGSNWSDPEVLAKGKLESDGYIANLESQLSNMREDMGKQDKLQAILDQLQNKAPAEGATGTVGRLQNEDSTADDETTVSQEFSEDRLKSLVEKTLTDRDSSERTKANLATVDKELDNTFGTEAKDIVEKKAKELGMDLNRLKEIAAESPNAFFTLIGEPKKAQANPLGMQGSVRTEGVSNVNSNERNFNYYQKLRRENRSRYYSPEVQQKMMTDAERLGETFYR